MRGRLVPSRHHAHDEHHRRRLAAVREHSGALTGAYHYARSEELLAREIDEDFGADSLTLAQVLVMPDCCVLLAAEHAGARVASFDDQLTKAAIARQLETISH